jgi:electron transfer DM13
MRRYELLPEAILAVALGIFLLDEPDAATSAFKSGRAIALMGLATLGWVAARLIVTRFVPWTVARLALFAAAAAAVIAVVVLPAYNHDTVVEALPAVTAPQDEAPPSPAPKPVPVRRGSFRGIDHRAEGEVTFYRHPDGRHVVGLEDFDIQPGPDYDVYVVPGSNRTHKNGGVRLDDLRGNRGTQFYEVPADVGLGDGPWTLLVWCQTFGVPVANATPA